MQTLECIKGRRSIRSYEDKKISHDIMNKIIEGASYAPSWKNTQIARYIVVEDKELIRKISKDCVMGFKGNTKTMEQSAALVLVTMINGRSGFERDGSFSTSKKNGWEMFDAGIATQTFCLSAWEEGIGTVIMGIFDEAQVAKVVEIPEGQQLAAIISVGYPAETPAAPKRKTVEQLVTYL